VSLEVRHLLITGLVQGVGYRYSMVMAAQRLDVAGWVRNRRDGAVEAIVAGNAEAVAAMIAWARHGPAGAEVAHVAVELGSGKFTGFEQRPTA
jgi:acylphosphatase